MAGQGSAVPARFPDPPVGVFDAAAYREYDPGPGRVSFAGAAVPASPASILVVGLTAVGDVLHFLPVAVALRKAFPKARLGWVVQDKARAMVANRPDLDAVFTFERHRWAKGLSNPGKAFSTVREILAFRRELSSGKWDLLFDPQGTFKSAVVNVLSGARVRVGFAGRWGREFNHLTANVRVELPAFRMHRVRKSLELLRAVGIPVEGSEAGYEPPAEALAEADGSLAEAGLAGKRFMAIHPGTSPFGARKRWPVARWGELALKAGREFGLRTLFVLGPIERGWKGGLMAAAEGSGAVAVEPRSLPHLAGIISRAACLAGSDSAPLHLASNMRVPVVGLYGPTDPVLFAPFYPPAVVVVKGLPCPSCGRPHCNHPVPRMEAIGVEDALAGLRLLMKLTG
jgi:ADP-heptose:LPS heptosyltransferase